MVVGKNDRAERREGGSEGGGCEQSRTERERENIS